MARGRGGDDGATPPTRGPVAHGSDRTMPAGGSGAASGSPAQGGTADERRLGDVDAANYQIQGEIGRGGMGRIVVARDRRLDRIVAVKLLHGVDPLMRVRFEREALVTAKLQHPAIVPVYEAGRFADGEPFYAMKLVSGRPLSEVIDEADSLRARIAILPSVIAVADALAYAHDRGVIHRDLKPQNVLCGKFGETVLIDWGLAKDRAAGQEPAAQGAPQQLPTGAQLTMAGEIMGTPAYMPPEQARGDEVDERADVYALGAMLYHLLAGTAPYTGKDSWDVLHNVATAAPPPLESKEPGVPADLAAIVGKAMAREPAERYPTAKELAEDLRRFQAGQLVAVHRYSSWEIIRRWIGRHRGAVLVGAAAILLLAVLASVGIAKITRERRAALAERDEATRQRLEAELQRGEAEEQRGVAEVQRTEADRQRGEAERQRGEAERQREETDAQRKDAEAARAAADRERAEAERQRNDARRQRSTAVERLARLLTEQGRRELQAGERLRALPYLAQAYATVPESPSVRMLVADAMRPLDALQSKLGGHQGVVLDAAFSPDGVHAVSAGEGSTARVWNAGTGKLVARLEGHTAEVRVLAFAPDGKTVVTGSQDGEARVWDTASWTSIAMLPAQDDAVDVLAFSADGTRLVLGSADHTATVWDTGSWKRVATLAGHERGIIAVRFAGGGKDRVVTASADRSARLWDAESGKQLSKADAYTDWMVTAISPSKPWVARARCRTSCRWRAPA